MKNLIRLLSINVLTIFDIHKLINLKTKSDWKKLIPKLLLYLYAFGALGISIFFYAHYALKGLITLGMPHILLVAVMAVSSIYLVIATVFKVNKIVFDAKDYSFLLALPLKKTTVISSKLMMLYLYNFIFTLFFMIPAYIAYLIGVNTTVLFHIFFIASLLFIPLVPTIIGAIIGSIITSLAANFKYKTLVNIVLGFALVLLMLYYSSKIDGITEAGIADLSAGFIAYFNRFYPLAKLYAAIIQEQSILSLLVYIGVSLGLFWLFQMIVSIFFDFINSKLNAVTINNQYLIADLKKSSSLVALYKKELTKYISSTAYVLNTAVGAVMFLASLFLLAFVGSDQLDAIMTIPGFSKIFVLYGPLVFSVFCCMSCTTMASISLEGKSFWLLKAMPVDIKELFIAKILVNLTLLIPTIVIGAALITYIASLTVYTFLLLIFTPTMMALFISGFGLLMNLYIPDFNWTNEIKVIKQSLPVFITLATGASLSIVPLVIKSNFKTNNPDLYSLLIGVFMGIIVVGTYSILFTKGKKIFRAL